MSQVAEMAYAGECFRCGYDLRGIPDDAPCPECGLLSGRSRQPNDELRHTRPAWLRSLATGNLLILAAFAAAAVWLPLTFAKPLLFGNILRALGFNSLLPLIGILFCFLVGVTYLTRWEQYPPADRSDAALRMLLRVSAWVLLVGATGFVSSYNYVFSSQWTRVFLNTLFGGFFQSAYIPLLLFCDCLLLPFLLFRRLRGLAVRARSARLAEHCTIVGIGASIAVLCTVMVCGLDAGSWTGLQLEKQWLLINLVAWTLSSLFWIWAIYLFVQFTIAFVEVGRAMSGAWKSGDRSTSPAGAPESF